ncbi:hypothetical protein AJ87_32200 [Rhizobium yanglingense]|nr:hypothetical protein AJ87_32200 [Rhizobium yanglingense]
MADLDARLLIQILQQFQHLRPAARIHGTALDRDQHMVGEADCGGQQRIAGARQVDDKVVRGMLVLADVLRKRGRRHEVDDLNIRHMAGNLVPAGNPVLRIGIENGDAVTFAGKFRREQKDGRGLACPALGVCKCDDWHVRSSKGNIASRISLSLRTFGFIVRLTHPFR